MTARPTLFLGLVATWQVVVTVPLLFGTAQCVARRFSIQ